MKVCIVTDQHFGCRKNSKLFHDYFQLFYENVFFPTLEQYGITTVIDMGDTFDSRKGIDFSSLLWAKNNYYDKLYKMNIKVHTIVGNHTAYYKNSNKVNSVDLLLREYNNLTVYSEPTEIKVDDLGILLLPWINSENSEKSLRMIQNTQSKVAMGHLELNGFAPYKGHIMDSGMDPNIFGNFKKVFSGHYHTRSNNGIVYYLGNPYEIYWNDVNDARGFTIFNTETLEHIPIDNPYRMFYNIYYEDTPHQTFDVREYENKIVRVIVRKKTNQKKFESFIDKLYTANISELKIVENFQIQESEDFEAFESEDTFSILQRYVNESECQFDKTMITNILEEVYKEALEIV
jgi:DNA repair exonuclease SbcCD nuclease subunit